MGALIEMKSRNEKAEPVVVEGGEKPVAPTPVDLKAWESAPKERTAAYFPTYSTVSKAMQTAMRGWVREWFTANPEILLRPHSAYPILVFQCTHPFSGRPTNIFTYDIQQTEALNRAFASAANKLGRELKTLDTKKLAWLTREHYFAYRSKEVVKYVMKNRRAIYRMLNVETMLMDAILKFAVLDLPKMGMEEATVILRRAFFTQLRRFSEEFDLSTKVDDLLTVVTDALIGKQCSDNAVPAPGPMLAQPTPKVIAMPVCESAPLEMLVAA